MALFTALLGNVALFVQAADRGLGKDWGYFDSLALVVRSNVWSYGAFPLHNPWACGGLDLLTNPQSRIFSPLVVSDLLLSPPLANLFGLVLYGFIGFLGALALLEHLKVSRVTALIGAALWLNASWFGLHFAEGHIPYGPMQLLPLVFYCALRLGSRRHLLGLAAVFSWFLLDGAIYALIFATLGITLMLLLGMVPRTEWRALVGKPRWPLLAIPVGAVLVAIPRIYPLVANVASRTPKLESYEMPWDLLRGALFDPLQTYEAYPIKPHAPWRFHEYACYVSLLGLALVLVTALVRRRYLRASWRLFVMLAFWLWVGAGWFPDENPWALFQKIPLANNAHIQSRLFIVMFLVFVVLVARALDAWRHRKLAFGALAALLVAESLFVRVYPTTQLVRSPKPAVGWELIASTTIDKTVAAMNGDPDHYLAGNRGSLKCYEPSFTPKRITATDRKPPLPEVAVLTPSPMAAARLEGYTPGTIDLAFDLPAPTPIVINTNALYGWQVEDDAGTVRGRDTDLLEVLPDAPRGHLRLVYAPPYVPWLVASWLAGLALLTLVWRRTRA